jgi:hypothetical protein
LRYIIHQALHFIGRKTSNARNSKQAAFLWQLLNGLYHPLSHRGYLFRRVLSSRQQVELPVWHPPKHYRSQLTPSLFDIEERIMPKF